MHKSRKSPAHSKTDIPLISIMCLWIKDEYKEHCLAYFFDILYWHVNFHDLNAIEEV